MDCDRARQLIDAAGESDLHPQERASLEVHLQTCDECRVCREQMSQLDAALSLLREATEAIPARAAGATAGRPQARRWLLRGALRAAAVIAIGVLSVLWMTNSQRQQSAPAPTGRTQVTTPQKATPVHIALAGRSAESYVAVERESSSPKVHVFWLYAVPGDRRD